MKKYVLSLVVLFLVSMFQLASAQEKKFEWVLGGGLDSPVSPDNFADEFNPGWTAKLAGGYFVTPQLTLGANLSYNRFGFDEGSFITPQSSNISGNDLSILEFIGVGKYYFLPLARTTNFYVLGGPGLAYSWTTDFTYTNMDGQVVTTDGDTETDFMLTAGAGVRYNVNDRWGVFVEGRYSHIFLENDDRSYLPVRIGLIF